LVLQPQHRRFRLQEGIEAPGKNRQSRHGNALEFSDVIFEGRWHGSEFRTDAMQSQFQAPLSRQWNEMRTADAIASMCLRIVTGHG
jgi:hypothetical protein